MTKENIARDGKPKNFPIAAREHGAHLEAGGVVGRTCIDPPTAAKAAPVHNGMHRYGLTNDGRVTIEALRDTPAIDDEPLQPTIAKSGAAPVKPGMRSRIAPGLVDPAARLPAEIKRG